MNDESFCYSCLIFQKYHYIHALKSYFRI